MSIYDPHATYDKDALSSCRQCGACCNQNCEHFVWQALKNIKNGEQFSSGVNKGYIKALCLIFDLDVVASCGCTLDQRKNFPYDPWQTPKTCSFRWTQVEPIPIEPGD